MTDIVNRPPHYTNHPSGVECIQVTEHMNFNLGNAVKYIWRAGEKGDAVTDLRKAAWYVKREIQRLSSQPEPLAPVTYMRLSPEGDSIVTARNG